MKNLFRMLMLSIVMISSAQADWMITSTAGQVTSVRTYQVGPSGLRAQLTISGADHTRGTGPGVVYFDSDKVNIDVVKSVMSLGLGAMATGKAVKYTYDCSLGGGGYGWGVAFTVIN